MHRPSIYEYVDTSPIMLGTRVRLRRKRLEDAANDFAWRKDDELCRLDATYPFPGNFESFYKLYSDQHFYPGSSCQLAIETINGTHIGNCSYYSIDNVLKEAEMGIMIGDKRYWNRGYGRDAVCTSLDYILSHTSLKRIYLKTLSWNERARRCFEKCGFNVYGSSVKGEYTFILMETYRSDRLCRTNGKKPLH